MIKTSLMVHGAAATALVRDGLEDKGWPVLFSGAGATAAASIVGYYPWFATFNALSARIRDEPGMMKHVRRGAIGVTASLVSDCMPHRPTR